MDKYYTIYVKLFLNWAWSVTKLNFKTHNLYVLVNTIAFNFHNFTGKKMTVITILGTV